jgi:hypothetical protein
MKMPELPQEAGLLHATHDCVYTDYTSFNLDGQQGRFALAAYVCAVLDALLEQYDDMACSFDCDWATAEWWRAQHDFLYCWRGQWAKYGRQKGYSIFGKTIKP